MKFRYQEKVRVKSGFYRNYTGVVVGFETEKTDSNVELVIYRVKLTLSKDPLREEVLVFKENELAARWF